LRQRVASGFAVMHREEINRGALNGTPPYIYGTKELR